MGPSLEPWQAAGRALSVFEDKAGADASVAFAHTWVAENAAHLFTSPPRVTEGEVVAHDSEA